MLGTVSELELLACYVQEKGEQQTFKQDKCSLSILSFLDTYYVTEILQDDGNAFLCTSKCVGIIRLSILPSNICNDIHHLLVTLITFGNRNDYITSIRGL